MERTIKGGGDASPSLRKLSRLLRCVFGRPRESEREREDESAVLCSHTDRDGWSQGDKLGRDQE